MNWKKFLKPDWRRIVLTLIIILIFPLPYWNGTLCEQCLEEPCSPCPDTNFDPALIGWYFTWRSSFYGHGRVIGWHNQALNVLEGILMKLLIIGLPISYLLSCLIIWVYDKYRKKRIRQT